MEATQSPTRKPAAEPAAAPAASGGVRNAVELFVRRVAESGPKVAMRYKAGAAWQNLTWNDWDRAAREIAGGLLALGLERGDRVCVLANSRPEWFMADIGILMAGAVTVPIYQSNTAEQCEYIITDCGAKVVIAENPSQLAKLHAPQVKPWLTGLTRIVYMDAQQTLEQPQGGSSELSVDAVVPAGAKAKLLALDALRELGRKWLAEHAGALDRAWEAVDPGQIFTIVYTSGTTGPPKGVVLTHANMVFECAALTPVLPVGETDEQLLFLPLAHIFAKLLEWTSISKGTVTSFAQNLNTLKTDLAEIRPTFMGAVPRVYEKFYVGIQANVKQSSPGKQKIFRWATEVGAQVSRAQREGRPVGFGLGLKHRVADRLVFSKLRNRLGLDRIRFLVSGGAPLAREIGEFFHSLGILVLEGYGLTETTGATHVNRLDRYRFGTVGPALPDVEIKIAADGEVLMRGSNIMREYYKKEADTREVKDSDGWFHSGDIGVIEDGFLRITDRKKDLIVTAGGKNVAPQNIENAIKARSAYVSQVMVHGDKRNFLTALVTLNEEAVVKWAQSQGLAHQDFADLTTKPELRKLIQEVIDAVNATLASYESIKKFAILPRDFAQETGELTPTLKVKRKVVTEKNKAILDGFYAN